MQAKLELPEHTRQLLQEVTPESQDLDTKVRHLLHAELLRRLARYHRTDRTLQQKYGMTFEEFVAQRVVQQQEHSWNVETDAMEWETAIGGIKTVERQLAELQSDPRV